VPVPADIKTWLQVEISSPAGASFVTLTPRQPMTATPLAGAARRALTADFATDAATATSATNATFATSAATATNATNAANATNAVNATNATNAQNVPWSGLTGQPSITTGSVADSNWQMLFINTTNNTFRGGMRLSNSGFFEVTNGANAANPNLARLNSAGTWSAVSDARLKTDVTSAEGNLTAALKLRPVNFRWKGDGVEDFGLVAQEVREVLPRLVTGDEAKDTLTLNYSQLSVVAIGAIQEQQAQRVSDRTQFDSALAQRDAEIAALKARLAAIEAALLKTNK
jgi:hypothetical protein